MGLQRKLLFYGGLTLSCIVGTYLLTTSMHLFVLNCTGFITARITVGKVPLLPDLYEMIYGCV